MPDLSPAARADRDAFLAQCRAIARYWATEPMPPGRDGVEHMVSGAIFTLLAMLDGDGGTLLNGASVVPRWAGSAGEDIAGGLHEHFYQGAGAMTATKPTIRYEDAAEHKTVSLTGFWCRTCGRFWDNDEHMARYCCATDFPCECGARIDGHRARCEACRQKHADEVYAKAEPRPWDGKCMLFSDVTDRFYATPDEFFSSAGSEYPGDEFPKDFHRKMRVYLTEEHRPHHFSLMDWLEDYLPEDALSGNYALAPVEKCVNDFIEAGRPWSWWQGKYAWDGSVATPPAKGAQS